MNRRDKQEVISAEAARLMKRIPDGAHVILLDRELGKEYPSEELARGRLAPLALAGRSHVAFVIGGAMGVNTSELLDRADEVWSFGPITLPHALARIVLLEQLYRAVKIDRGEKYHW